MFDDRRRARRRRTRRRRGAVLRLVQRAELRAVVRVQPRRRRRFTSPASSWSACATQTKTGWVAACSTTASSRRSGPVAEPYLHAFPAADEFFPLLLTGKLTLAEVYWRTNPLTSWMMQRDRRPAVHAVQGEPADEGRRTCPTALRDGAGADADRLPCADHSAPRLTGATSNRRHDPTRSPSASRDCAMLIQAAVAMNADNVAGDVVYARPTHLPEPAMPQDPVGAGRGPREAGQVPALPDDVPRPREPPAARASPAAAATEK